MLTTDPALARWLPVIQADWGSHTINVTVGSGENGSKAQLETVHPNHELFIAFGFKVAFCQVTAIQHSVREGSQVCMLMLQIKRSDFGNNIQIGMIGVSADQIAEERARLLLLGQLPEQPEFSWNSYQKALLVEARNAPFQVTKAIFPELFKSHGQNTEAFLDISWITAVAHLRLSGTVSSILSLTLGISGTQLSVDFIGIRRSQDRRRGSVNMRISGSCSLV
jgi:hypothetical protein